jgi:hypothetical protein
VVIDRAFGGDNAPRMGDVRNAHVVASVRVAPLQTAVGVHQDLLSSGHDEELLGVGVPV